MEADFVDVARVKGQVTKKVATVVFGVVGMAVVV